jgi:hypothetical protein
MPVDQHLAGVGLGVVGFADQPPAPPGPHERVLGQLLRLGRVAGEQEAEPAQPLILLSEEPPEVLVGRHASSSPSSRRYRPRATAAHGFTQLQRRASQGRIIGQEPTGRAGLDTRPSGRGSASPAHSTTPRRGSSPPRQAHCLTLKHQPRDHRSSVAGTVTVRPIHAPGFQLGFFVTFIPRTPGWPPSRCSTPTASGSAASSATTSKPLPPRGDALHLAGTNTLARWPRRTPRATEQPAPPGPAPLTARSAHRWARPTLSGPARRFVRSPARTLGLSSCNVWGRFACRHQTRSTPPRDAAVSAAGGPKPGAGPGRATSPSRLHRS